MVFGFVFGGRPAAESMHETTVIEPVDPGGGGCLEIGEPVERTGTER